MAVDIKKVDLAALRAQIVEDSLDRTFDPSRIVVHGPSGAGKTILACSLSRYWNTQQTLDDIALIDVDGNSADSLINFGKRVPNVINYSKLLKDVPDPKECLLLCIDLAASIPGVETIIGDTFSVWGKDYEAFLRKNPSLYTANGVENTQKFWGMQSSANNDVAYKLRNTGKNFVVNFHSKHNVADLNRDTTIKETNERRQIAQGLPGEPDVCIEAVGAARDLWPKLVSLVLACRVVVNGKTETRRVYTRVEEGMQAKSRFNKFLSPIEEPDLGAMVGKIKAAIAAQKESK